MDICNLRPMFVLFVGAILVGLSGCSMHSDLDDSSSELPFANKGPVLVSDTNEYIGTNQFLNVESDNDSNLRGFLETQGVPQAIELIAHGEYPDEMLFYYIQKQELYKLVELPKGWAIFAPAPFNPQILAKLARDDSIRAKYPSLEQYAPKQNIPEQYSSEQIAGQSGLGQIAGQQSKAASAKRTFTTEVDDDVAHIVKGTSETISDISVKYTGSKEMASAIGRINGMAVNEKLADGTSIRIPRYMLKSLQAPVSQAVQVPVKTPRQLPLSTPFVPPTTIVESNDTEADDGQ